jgi:hypothetical protein
LPEETASRTGQSDGPPGMPLPPKKEAWPWVMVGCGALIMLGLAATTFLGVRSVTGTAGGAGSRAARAGCTQKLMQISGGLQAYAADHGGAFPAELSALIPAYVPHYTVFVCPGDRSGTAERLRGGKLTNTNSSYEYLPGRDTSLPGRFVLAFDRSTENHGRRGFNVLWANGCIEWWEASRLEELNGRLDAEEVAIEAIRLNPGKREEILGEHRKKYP